MRPLALLAALLPLAASGQGLTLTPRADANAALPPSVRVFDVSGSGVRASLVRADFSAADWTFEATLSDASTGNETVASFAADDGVLVAVNGGYYGGSQSYSLVLNEGQRIAPNIGALNRSGTVYYPTRSAVGVSASRTPDVAWVYDVGGATYAYPAPSPNAPGSPQPQPTAAFPEGGAPWDVEAAIGGGPVLVQDGQAKLTWTEEVFFGGSGVDTTSARARTAVGYTEAGDLLIVAVPEANGLTLPALARLMVDLGAIEAVNLDGGGSTALTAGGVGLVTSTRPVASALRLLTPRGGEMGIVFDTGDEAYRETGGWFESANAPYYGATRSRLNEVGTGEDRAAFVFEGIEEGYYGVLGLWTAAPNRARDTPFIVHQGGVADTVRIDQTTTTDDDSLWSTVWFGFLTPGDSLVVTDDATGTTSPAYVCVDAVRLFPTVPPNTENGPEAGPALRLGPNPVSARLDVTVTPAVPGTVRVEILDALGRVVRTEAVVAVGEVRLGVDVRGLAPGVYVVRATSEAGTSARTVSVVR